MVVQMLYVQAYVPVHSLDQTETLFCEMETKNSSASTHGKAAWPVFELRDKQRRKSLTLDE